MTNEKIKVEDNFLIQEDFDNIQSIIKAPTGMMESQNQMNYTFFPWFYTDAIDLMHHNGYGKFMFNHVFYYNGKPNSEHMSLLASIVRLLRPIAIFKIKANLLTETPDIVENEFHVDMNNFPEEKLKQWTTSIFYVNSNNGYTKFEDGTKVESVANRMLTFPANMKHTGTTCSDEKIRVVINFNYFN
jgi:hypothetical protein